MAHTPTAGDRYKVQLKNGVVVERPYSTAANAALLKRSGAVCIDERIAGAQAGGEKKVVQVAKKNPAAVAVNLENKIAELEKQGAVITHDNGTEEVKAVVEKVAEPASKTGLVGQKGKPGPKKKAAAQ